MTAVLVEGPAVVLDGAVCCVLEQHAGLDQLRQRLRGRNDDLYRALLAVRSVALIHVATAAQQADFRAIGSGDDNNSEVAASLTSSEVAAWAQLTTRAVTRAAELGQLRGEKRGGRWVFDPADVEAWMAMRSR